MTDSSMDYLPTPCGAIAVMDETGRRVPFSLRENPYNPVYSLFYGTRQEEALRPDANYLLCVPTSALTIGHTYSARLLGAPLHFGGSDEHTEAVSGTLRGYSIAIGAYDPNDEEKIRQAVQRLAAGEAVEPYDESSFTGYTLERLADFGGFSFRLLDRSMAEILFAVAYVQNGRAAPSEYEAAVEFWTT